MKKNTYHIVCAWALLLFFVVGQYVVYAHTHASGNVSVRPTYQNSSHQSKQTIAETCRLCDAMHHNAMAVNNQVFFAPIVTTSYFYKAVEHHFVSVALILSAGRSPPMA